MSGTIALNLGNTNVSGGYVDVANRTCLQRVDLGAQSDLSRVRELVARLQRSYADGFDATVTVCSVRPEDDTPGSELLTIPGIEHVQRVGYSPLCGIRIDYDDPYTLGADRYADLLYAHAHFPQQELLVIDAGTAVTTNMLDAHGVFRGGTIMPGIACMHRSLCRDTARLPHVDEGLLSDRLFGHSSRESIAAGVTHAVVGALERVVARARKRFPDVRVCTCGGGWPCIAEMVSFPFTHIPDMTLIGTALFSLASTDRTT